MLKVCGKRDIGRCRTVNQDYVYVSETPIGNLPNLFIVADGMGGHKAGELASEYAVLAFVESIEKSMKTIPLQILKRAAQYANFKLREKAKESENYQGMGTTLVAVTIWKQMAYVISIGDSRLYKINEEIAQVTTDHSLVEEMIRLGEISKEEGRNHPDKNIITRAIGVSEEIEPDFFDISLEDGEQLLLCSDGLTNMLCDLEIKGIIKKHLDIEEKVELLIQEANKEGGKDNIGLIVIEREQVKVKQC